MITTAKCAYCGGDLEVAGRIPDRMFAVGAEFEIGRCVVCHSLMLLDAPSDASVHYPQAEYHAFRDDDVGCSVPSLRSARTGRVVRAVLPAMWSVDGWLAARERGPGVSVLDVGCGSGAALDTYRAAGWDTWGVEPDETAASLGRKRGHRVLTGDFGAVEVPSHEFALVRFRHSLEHLSDPLGGLAKAIHSLRPGGLCLVEIPNPASWLARASGMAWWQLDAPRHVSLAHPRALRRALESLGCRAELRQTYGYGSGFAATVIFWAQSHGLRSWTKDWRLRSDWKPAGYGALRLLGHAVSAIADLAGRGDSLRILARKVDGRAAAPQDGS